MGRGVGREKTVRGIAYRRRLIDGAEQALVPHDVELLCCVVMGNHLNHLLKTPRPNHSARMQSFLSGYAIWAWPRWWRLGDLFRSRYRAEILEDEP
jgi:hypothetical protein